MMQNTHTATSDLRAGDLRTSDASLNSDARQTDRQQSGGSLRSVTTDIAFMTTVFVNLYTVGAPGEPWVLVDTGLPLSAGRIRRAAEARYGAGARPQAIILTHGHFDHAGNALELARDWRVPIYAHELEMPYLTGRSDYPPQDPTVGGALAQMSRLFPHSGYDFGELVRPLPADGTVPELPEWRWLHTPGHTHGHISLYRERDRVLLSGDALATVNQESPITLLTLEKELRQPPAPFTTDWLAARRSIERLATLRPAIIAAGHGLPITEADAAAQLERFAATFTAPPDGRYVREAARADERGVIWLPPPVPDTVRKVMIGVGLATVGALAFAWARRRRGEN